MSFLVGLQFREQLPPVVADELDQITAATQTAFTELSDRIGSVTSDTAQLIPMLATVQTTAVKTTILSVTIPANRLSDGAVVTVQMAVLAKNNKGSSGVVTLGLSYAGIADVSLTNGTPTWTNSATEFKCLWRFTAQRVGADLWVSVASYPTAGNVDQLAGHPDMMAGIGPADNTGGSLAGGNVRVCAAPNFAIDQLLAINATLTAADATFYIKPQSANVKIGRV